MISVVIFGEVSISGCIIWYHSPGLLCLEDAAASRDRIGQYRCLTRRGPLREQPFCIWSSRRTDERQPTFCIRMNSKASSTYPGRHTLSGSDRIWCTEAKTSVSANGIMYRGGGSRQGISTNSILNYWIFEKIVRRGYVAWWCALDEVEISLRECSMEYKNILRFFSWLCCWDTFK